MATNVEAEMAIRDSTLREATKSLARAFCQSSGPKPGCLCGGRPTHCHALTLYMDEAVAGAIALDAAGLLRGGS